MKSKAVIIPYAVWILIFTIVPLGLIVYFALTNSSGSFTMDNFKEIEKYSGTFLKSIYLGAISTLICLVLAYPIAFSISRAKGAKQSTMVMLIMLPMWMNFLLRTYAWMTLLEGNGLINQFLGLFGIGPFEMINTEGAIVLGMVYNFLPYMILPLYSIMTKIDKTVIEAAQDIGASTLNIFRRIILPMSVPGILSGVTMVFVPAVSTFIISKLLGGGKQLLIGDIIEMMFVGNAVDYNVGAMLSLILMILMLICMAIMNLFGAKDENGGGGIIL